MYKHINNSKLVINPRRRMRPSWAIRPPFPTVHDPTPPRQPREYSFSTTGYEERGSPEALTP